MIRVLQLLLIISTCYILWNSCRKNEHPTVYGLMVTLNDNIRKLFVKHSIRNFREQTYKNKHLIVIDQSEDGKVIGIDKNDTDVTVIRIPKPHSFSLGQLRNYSLTYVPENALWTTWDDDDWRHPEYLTLCINELLRTRARFLMIQHRLEYNLKTGFTHGTTIKSGLMTFFAYTDSRLSYDSVNTMEDVTVKKTALKYLPCHRYDNDAKIYLRLVHGNNTSLYVDNDKIHVRNTANHRDFFEWNVNPDDNKFVLKIVSDYYKHVYPVSPSS